MPDHFGTLVSTRLTPTHTGCFCEAGGHDYTQGVTGKRITKVEGSEADEKSSPIGAQGRTRMRRTGIIVAHDPKDPMLEFKAEYDDGHKPTNDWISFNELVCECCAPESDSHGINHTSNHHPGHMSIDLWLCKGVGVARVMSN